MGDGLNINLWSDPWLRKEGNFNPETPTTPSLARLKIPGLWIPGHKEWDVELIQELFSETDASAIINIPVSTQNHPDTILWHHDKRGHYTVKSGYHVARGISVRDNPPKIRKG